jgi:precorrin-2/cobalt-factor-2 C20-methyltransferase
MVNKALGKLYGIGVGPGDPELVTIKAERLLKSVQVVCGPKASETSPSLALEAVKGLLTPGCELLEIVFPMTQDERKLFSSHQRAAQKILSRLKEGKDVAYVTLGDPLFYSSYAYLLKAIKGIAPEVGVETVPGVTSLSACAALRNVALACGEEDLAILPSCSDAEKLKTALLSSDNIVIMKVSKDFETLHRALEELGMLDKAILFANCGSGREEIVSGKLEPLLAQKLPYFSLVLIKKGTP